MGDLDSGVNSREITRSEMDLIFFVVTTVKYLPYSRRLGR